MSFQLSPGVQVHEKDLTNVVPAVSSSTGAFVGQFQWGPVLEVFSLGSETDLVRFFGKPNDDTFSSFFAAANFLAYTNALLLVRVVGTGGVNAVSSGSGILIKNQTDWDDNYSGGEGTAGAFVARYAGALGNSLKVSLADVDTFEKTLTGTITTLTNSSVVAGVSTEFLTEVHVGTNLYTSAGVLIGTVLGVSADDSLALTANAATAVTGHASAVGNWVYHDLFDDAPGTTDYATRFGGSSDEVHVIVEDRDGSFTGVPGTILEKWVGLSKASDARTSTGAGNYYKDVLSHSSQYIWWTDHPTNINSTGSAWGSVASSGAFKTLIGAETHKLVNGADGSTPSDGDVEEGYDLFANAESFDVSLIINGAHSMAVGKYIIETIAEGRLDCVGFVSPTMGTVVNNPGSEALDVVAERVAQSFNVNSSYGFMDSGWKYQYDKYNDKYRWLPLNPDVAGLCAQTDATNDPWWSPGGFTRGQIKNVVKLAWSPNQTDRDTLYKKSVNPVVSFPGLGTVLYGDKTLLAKPSAFDRINVRRLFIVLEKAISTASKFMLFEFNDAFTRALFRNMVEPFLRDVKGRRGVTDFRVICDETNNTGEVIDRNEFIGDIYIKPVRSINFITLNFIATRTGVKFEEIVGS